MDCRFCFHSLFPWKNILHVTVNATWLANISKVLKSCILYFYNFVSLFCIYMMCGCISMHTCGGQSAQIFWSWFSPSTFGWVPWTKFTLSRVTWKAFTTVNSFLVLLMFYGKRKQWIKVVTYFSKFINLRLLKLHPDSLVLRQGTYTLRQGWANFISTTLLISVFLYELNKKMQSHLLLISTSRGITKYYQFI